MCSSSSPSESPRSAAIAEEAVTWLVRRDRGLTPAEQDEYLQWLCADPRHAEILAQHAAAFERMMQLYEWQPGQSTEPNPDLFALRRRWRWPLLSGSLAAAAALAVGFSVWLVSSDGVAPAQKSHLRVNEKRALADGSLVELKDGSRLQVEFSPAARRVRLTGEAHFKVAKDAGRPFVVDAAGVRVRAVGTAFNVRLGADAVDVLVTEGTVQVAPTAEAIPTPTAAPEAEAATITTLNAGQRVRVNLAGGPAPQVAAASDAEIAATLEWQGPRLQFYETPLATAVREFNAHNASRSGSKLLKLGEDELGRVPIGGTFRIDNVDAFVRLLELTIDVRAETRGDEIVLTRAR